MNDISNLTGEYAKYYDMIFDMAIGYGPKLILAILTLIIGLWLIRLLTKSLAMRMEASLIDISLRKFILSLIGITIKVLLFISVASMIGIQMTSFIAILGAATLAIGLALQGSLANFAGGVLILLFKPYKIGDSIEAQGFSGKVSDIQIFNTVLKTGDNKTVIIPNGNLSNNNIMNYSTEGTRRVDMVFGIGYSDDLRKAKDLLNKIVMEDSRVLKDPVHLVAVSELADSSVNFVVRVWCKSSDYWNIFFDMQEKVKLEFDKNGISIPFPQRDIHLFQESVNSGK